jgi:hypothetical protein
LKPLTILAHERAVFGQKPQAPARQTALHQHSILGIRLVSNLRMLAQV